MSEFNKFFLRSFTHILYKQYILSNSPSYLLLLIYNKVIYISQLTTVIAF